MNSALIDQLRQIGLHMQANGLPYNLPLHPNFVHLTLGLFITAILFDIAATLFPLFKPILRFLSLPALQSGFYAVGWYNLIAAVIVTFFTVTAGLFELLLATPSPTLTSSWGLGSGTTMLLHGVGGVLLLAIFAGMAAWRSVYRSSDATLRPVSWSYLVIGVGLLGVLYLHGTLGAQLGGDFGIHNTAAQLLEQKKNPNDLLSWVQVVLTG